MAFSLIIAACSPSWRLHSCMIGVPSTLKISHEGAWRGNGLALKSTIHIRMMSFHQCAKGRGKVGKGRRALSIWPAQPNYSNFVKLVRILFEDCVHELLSHVSCGSSWQFCSNHSLPSPIGIFCMLFNTAALIEDGFKLTVVPILTASTPPGTTLAFTITALIAVSIPD